MSIIIKLRQYTKQRERRWVNSMVWMLVLSGVGLLLLVGTGYAQQADEVVLKHRGIYDEVTTAYQKDRYTLERPFVRVNPFGNNPLVAEVRFASTRNVKVSVFVKELNGGYSRTDYKEFVKQHRYPILGLYPAKTNEITLVATDRNGRNFRKELTIKTDALPSDYPAIGSELKVLQRDQTKLRSGYYFIMLVKRKLPMGAVFLYSAIDSTGQVRWINTELKGHFFKRTQYGTMLVSLENTANLYHTDTIYEMDDYGQYLRSWKIPDLVHHEVYVLSNRNMLLLSNSKEYIEDTIIELDYKTGKVIKEWNVGDYVPATRDPLPGYTHVRNKDWAHLNSLDYDESTDLILVSSRNQSVIAAINKTTGKLAWLSGPHENWEDQQRPYLLKLLNTNLNNNNNNNINSTAGIPEWHWGQHCIRALPNGRILVFDNGRSRSFSFAKKRYAFQTYSRAVEYVVNAKNKTIEQVWEFGRKFGHELYSSYVSGIQSLPAAGTLLINFGGITKDYLGNPVDDAASYNSARIFEVTKDSNKKVLLEVSIRSGDYTKRYGFRVYRAVKHPTLHF
ncbi:arylsulfate sulfotransferase AssT [Spirochaetota bacterium]|nr:arylsulfate sulfotransferase AssT [Spirochaetota bacterium]